MYFVSSPAAACDDFSGITSDNASTITQKTDLKLVASPSSTPEASTTEPETDSGSLAARILQMHTASAAFEQPVCRPPKLVGAPEDPALDLPGILKRQDRQDTSAGPHPKPVPQPAADATRPAAPGHGPSFKALLVGATVIAALLGGGFYFGAAGMVGKGQETRTVETLNITTEPTIESLIAEDASTQSRSLAAGSNGPSAQQIAKAKDRIRRAFNASGAAARTPNGQPRVSGPPVSPSTADAGKDQARLASASPSFLPTLSPHVAATLPPVADESALTVIAAAQTGLSKPSSQSKGETTADFRSGRPESGGPAGTTARDAGGNVTEKEPPQSASDFQTGTITASVNLRQSADKDATVIGVIPSGTEVRYDSCGLWWCGVVYQGQSGFVGQKYLNRSQ